MTENATGMMSLALNATRAVELSVAPHYNYLPNSGMLLMQSTGRHDRKYRLKIYGGGLENLRSASLYISLLDRLINLTMIAR